jgi:hypothetical protein
LRDLVVTEYGIADLRGRSDAEIAAALIGIADARFQDALVKHAKASCKLPGDWRVPDRARENTPERLEARLRPLGARGLLPLFPLGTDFDGDEQRLVPALQWLAQRAATWRGRAALVAGLATASPVGAYESALARMGLARPKSLREWGLRRIVAAALHATDGSGVADRLPPR